MEKINEKDMEFRNGDSGPKYLVKGPKWEGGIIVFKPGQKLGAHLHREVEETFYFMEGTGKIYVDDKENRAVPGDVYRISPGEKHDIFNDGTADLRMMFIKLKGIVLMLC